MVPETKKIRNLATPSALAHIRDWGDVAQQMHGSRLPTSRRRGGEQRLTVETAAERGTQSGSGGRRQSRDDTGVDTGDERMKSPVIKRSIVIAGHKTSVSLEDAFWKGLKDIAGGRDMTLSELVAAIDTERQHGNLSSAIRLFVLDHYRYGYSDAHMPRGVNGEMIASQPSAPMHPAE
jgi:predicted DNA-binding ribbon-helix-helix protein